MFPVETFSSQESVGRYKRLQGGAERGAAMNCIGFQGRLLAAMENRGGREGLAHRSHEAGLLSADLPLLSGDESHPSVHL